jgi:NADPH-dependent glutamate synthase beta subunit-like oxidoreductase
VLLRKKYRIRIYNCSDRSIKLERKKKFGSYIYKEAAPLTHAECDAVSGAATVILAMGAGKQAAKAIDKYIKSKK